MKVTLFWDDFSRRFKIEGFKKFTDLDEQARRALWFKAQALGLNTPREFFDDAVKDIAASKRRHPVREYLGGLQWDGTPRVGNWLSVYLGVEDTPYTRAVGKLFMVAAVRRVRRPGVKFDHLLVLIGPQGAGKSSAGVALVPKAEWFDDGLVLGAETKIVLEQTAGKWLLEINEMRGGKETEAIKAMITRTHDTARKAYGEDANTVPRQFVMIGTADKKELFNDAAGNRRYLPVTVGVIDLDGLRKQRDQLWAEAAAIEASGEMPSLVLPADVLPDAKAAQQEHEMTDPAYETLERQLGDFGGEVDKETVYAMLGLEDVARRDPKKLWAMKNAMKRLGWEESKIRDGENRRRIYKKAAGTQLRFTHKPEGLNGQPFVLSEPILSIIGRTGAREAPRPAQMPSDGASARRR
jgi:predicted P-loop ATPase